MQSLVMHPKSYIYTYFYTYMEKVAIFIKSISQRKLTLYTDAVTTLKFFFLIINVIDRTGTFTYVYVPSGQK